MLARSSGEWKATKARGGGELDALLLPPLEGKSLSLFSLPNLCWFIYMPHTHMGDGDTHTPCHPHLFIYCGIRISIATIKPSYSSLSLSLICSLSLSL